jgi:hypothetical protein
MVEFLQYDKITVKMSWLFFAKTLESLCNTLRVVNSSEINRCPISFSSGLLFVAISKRNKTSESSLLWPSQDSFPISGHFFTYLRSI